VSDSSEAGAGAGAGSISSDVVFEFSDVDIAPVVVDTVFGSFDVSSNASSGGGSNSSDVV